jgi:pantetheine-phosphate adenylyltransferase
MLVCIGGTFDVLHQGHKQLITTACKTAGEHGFVFIGITTGTFAQKRRTVSSFEQRKTAIENYLLQQKKTPRFIIGPIQDRYGPSINGEFDAIVVSPETRPVAEEINEKRRQLGKKPLQIVVIPFVLAEDNRPISSTRIRRKEMNEEGTLLKEE